MASFVPLHLPCDRCPTLLLRFFLALSLSFSLFLSSFSYLIYYLPRSLAKGAAVEQAIAGGAALA